MPKRVRNDSSQRDRKRQKTMKNIGVLPQSKSEKEEKRVKNLILRDEEPNFDEDEEISSYDDNTDQDDLEDGGDMFLSSSEDEEEVMGAKDANEGEDVSSSSDDDDENKLSIDEKRLKIAKSFMERIKDDDEEDIKESLSANRNLLFANKDKALFDITAGLEDGRIKTETIFLKGHKNSVTCCSLVENTPHIAYTGGKDCCILRWDLNAQKKVLFSKGRRNVESEGRGHEGQILSIAVSHDDRYLVSGGQDNLIKVWDVRSGNLLDNLDGHFAKVTGLTFRKGSYDFYSCSEDRTVRAWDASEQAMASILYGHTNGVNDIHALDEETCITGSMDTTFRFWKIDQETQLLFNGHQYPIDTARMISQVAFVTGSQDGSVCLWGKAQRKAVAKYPNAHGGKWISSVAGVPYGNLIASGSSDGFLRLYKADSRRGLVIIKSIPQHGYINCMEFAMRPGASHNRFMVYGVGIDHRLGRWERLSKVKTGLGIVRFVDAES